MTETQVERDVRDHARIITELINRLSKIENERATEHAVAEVEEVSLNDRLRRIEESIKQVYDLGKWLLGSVGALILTAIVGFVLKGGFGG